MRKLRFIIIIVFLFAFLIVWQRFYVLKLTMIVDKQKLQYEKMHNKYLQLYIQYTELKSIQRLEKYAIDTLKMLYPNGEMYVSITRGK